MKQKYYLALISILFLVVISFFGFFKTFPSVLSSSDASVFGNIMNMWDYQNSKAEFSALTKFIDGTDGIFSIYVEDLSNTNIYEYNSDLEMYGASLFKFPMVGGVLKQVEMGTISLDDQVQYTYYDSSSGTGTINMTPVGTMYSYSDLVTKMLKESDNTAQMMVERSLGWDLLNPAYLIVEGQENFLENDITSAKSFSRILKAYFESDYLNQESKNLILDLSSKTSFDNRIHAGLDPHIKFSHKIGSWPEESSWHDCGMVTNSNKKIIVCLMSKNTTYSDFSQVAKSLGEFISDL